MEPGSDVLDVPFIGRVDELTRLHRVLGEVVTGSPRLVLVSGEAGVGKSRLVHELTTRAREGGALTLFGACHEDVDIPFLPIATALRPVSDRLDRWPASGEPVGLSLYLDATETLLAAASERTIVVVFEDAHWADAASADLLVHLATSALHDATDRRLGLMIVVTSRRSWAAAEAGTLDRLARSPAAVVVPLRPFGSPEVHAMLTAAAGGRPEAGLVEELLDVTGGNALLLRSIIGRLQANGRLVPRGGELHLTGGHLLTPLDIDDEMLLRLDKAKDCIPLLTTMAFLGNEGSVGEARAVDRRNADIDLDDAVAAQLLQVDGDRYRFEHPAVRHVLYQQPPEDERAALHLRIADALEALGADTDRAWAIAHHLRLAGDLATDERARAWALKAADQAWEAGAWAAAARAYEMAIDRADDTGDDERGEWLLRAGVAAYRGQDDRYARYLETAATFARDRGDVLRWAEAALLRARYTSTTELGRPIDTTELEALLAAVADVPSLRARVLATLAEAHLMGRDRESGRRYLAEAEAVVAAGADEWAVARTWMSTGLQDLNDFELDDAKTAFTKAAAAAASAGDALVASAAEARLALARLASGETMRALRSLEQPRRENARLGFWRDQQLVSGSLASIAALDVRSVDCERLCGEAIALFRMQEYAYTPGLVYPVLVASRSIRGDRAGAVDAIDAWSDAGGRGTWRYRLLVDAWHGDVDAVREAVEDRPWRAPSSVELFTLDAPCVQLEVASFLGVPAMVSEVEPLVEAAHRKGVVLALAWPWLLSRLLGDARLVHGDLDGAGRWFEQAVREATATGATLELGRARAGQARVAAARGARADAIGHARGAAGLLDGIGALTFAHAARQLCSALGSDSDAPRPALRTILVTDLASSTALNVRAGDERYVELLGDHDRVIRARLQRHLGMEFKHTGDGICAWFASASDAVACALGIRDDLERSNAVHPELPMVTRIGIAAGEPVPVGDDLFGLAVVTASRICSLAAGSQVYVAGDVARMLHGKGYALRPVDTFTLRGLPGSTEVFEALSTTTVS